MHTRELRDLADSLTCENGKLRAQLREKELQNREYREALEKVYKRLNDTVPADYDIYPELSKLVAQALVEKRFGPTPMNYQELLQKYMALVDHEEGVDFVPEPKDVPVEIGPGLILSVDEQNELWKIALEGRE